MRVTIHTEVEPPGNGSSFVHFFRTKWLNWLRKMRRLATVHAILSLMIIGINFNPLLLSEEIKFGTATLNLRGLIYHSLMEHHFTSVIVNAEGIMCYHDGITTGRTCIENRLRSCGSTHIASKA
jgi:hypothetical protein